MSFEPGALATALRPAIELPSEIVSCIVEDLCDLPFRSSKYGLSACSLTCRYWAKLLQPLLFEELKLRGLDDIAQLLEFFQRSPQLATFVRRIDVEQSLDTCSWFHHTQKVLHFLAYDVIVSLTIRDSNSHKSVEPSNPPPHDPIPSSSPFPLYTIPRRLPLSHLRLRDLEIDGIQLRRAADLVRIICGLPNLVICAIQQVKFLEPYSPEIQQPALNRRYKMLRHLEVSGCDDGIMSKQLALASYLVQDGRVWDVEDTWPQIVNAIIALHSPSLSTCRRGAYTAWTEGK